MTKYEIRCNIAEIKREKDIHKLCTIEQAWQDPTIEESFDSKDEALRELKKYRCKREYMSGYWLVTEYYIEVNEYDEEGEFITGGDIVEIADHEIKSIKELRSLTGMTRQSFADFFKIPYRTVENWERGDRECPEYLFELMVYKLKNENMI